MKAVTFQDIERVVVEEVSDPGVEGPGDVIVKVELAALCGSDMHVYHGRETGLDTGTIMGHEFVGRVVETGSEVVRFKTGDSVICPFTVNCGECYFCQMGLTARCIHSRLFGWVEHGKGLHGVHAEFVRVPMADATLISLPDELSLEEGVLMGDNFPTGYFCTWMAELDSRGNYAVVGCGPVGLMTIAAAKLRGAEDVFALDQYKLRLGKAELFGATPINISDESHRDVLLDATNGRGMDAVMEAVGSNASMKSAFELLRPGGILATVGVQAYEQFPFEPPDIYDKNLTLKSGRCSARYYSEQLLPEVIRHKIDIASIITHTFDLDDAPEAYRLFDTQKDACIKVLLKP